MNNDRKPKPFKMSFSKFLEVIKGEITKIISFKIKKNKALNQTEIIIRGETKMTDDVIKKTKTKKEPKLHPEIKQFMDQQNKFNSDVKEFIQEQNKFNNDIKEFIQEQKKFNSDVKEFMQDQNKKWEEQVKFNKSQNDKWEEQIKFNKQMQESNQVILSSIQEILLRMQRIEKCPTIKKELDELE